MCALIMQNNDWKDTQRNLIEGTPYEPADDRESSSLRLSTRGVYLVLTGNGQPPASVWWRFTIAIKVG